MPQRRSARAHASGVRGRAACAAPAVAIAVIAGLGWPVAAAGADASRPTPQRHVASAASASAAGSSGLGLLTGTLDAVTGLLGGTLKAAPSAPAAPASPTPSPTATGPRLPVQLDLGILQVNLSVPLDVGDLLAGRRAGTPTPTASTSPTSTAPAPRPTPSRTTAPITDVPTRIAGQAPVVPVAATSAAPASATPSSSPTTSRSAPRDEAGVFERALRPGSPVMILLSVVLICSIGTAIVVRMGRRGGRRSA